MEKDETGISVIVCSVKPELCNQMLESVKNTIGTNFETIVFDNREKQWGICKVYNYCAQKAKFPYLCFIHEDIIMPSPNWGMNMVMFYEKTTDCGVIGFAGGTVAKRNFCGWECGRYRWYFSADNSKTHTNSNLNYRYKNPDNVEFAKVVTVDGLFLFVKRSIWIENPFDEKLIKGFHFYDADFSFAIAQKWQNYVCLTLDIYHFSVGKPDKTYFENARIFQKKWKHALPLSIDKKEIGMIKEMDTAYLLFANTYRLGLKSSINHFIKINGVLYFFVFCFFYIPIKKLEKIIKIIKQKL